MDKPKYSSKGALWNISGNIRLVNIVEIGERKKRGIHHLKQIELAT